MTASEGTPVSGVDVDAEVDIRNEAGNFDLAVRLTVTARGIERGALERLVEKARGACPYARATRNNVPTTVAVAP